MPRKGYTTVGISQKLYEDIQKQIDALNTQAGYRKFRSASHFVEQALINFMTKKFRESAEDTQELLENIVDIISDHPELQKRILFNIFKDQPEEALKKVDEILKEEGPFALMEHFNLGETGVRILDRNLTNGKSRGRIIDVYFKPDKAWCEHCQSDSCDHVKFALSLPEVQKIIKKKGWKILNP